MADYLLVRDSDDVIISHCTSSMSETGSRLEDVAAQSITGDSVPTEKSDMVGGTLTTGFVYTALAAVDWADRNRAWEEAQTDHADNDALASPTLKWHRCVLMGCKQHLVDADWDLVIAAYPAA